MKTFRFRLEPVLRVRSQRLERARVELAEALRRVQEARQAAQESAAALRRAGQRLATRLSGDRGLLAGEFEAFSKGADRLRERAASQREQAVQSERRVGECRLRTTQAHARLRALEKLRERDLEIHRRESARREEAELEELARARRVGEPC